MANSRKEVADLSWIHDYRRLKQQKAEHDARDALDKAVLAKEEYETAQSIRSEAFEQCLNLASSGQQLDLIMAQLWSAELHRRQQKENEAKQLQDDADRNLETAQIFWRTALMLTETAESKLSDGRRRWEEEKEQKRLAENDDMSASRLAVS
jgi:hypothetical protein